MKRKLLIFFIILFSVSIASGSFKQKQAVIALQSVTAHTNYTLDANCMGAWFMNGASGGDGSEDETDRSGEGQTLSVSATKLMPDSASVPAGYSGKSRDFEKGDPDYLFRAESDTNGFDISGANQDMSICVWVKPESTPTTNAALVIVAKSDGDDAVQYELRLVDAADTEYFRFAISSDGTYGAGYTTAVGSTDPDAGTYYHVCGVYDDDEGASENLKVYVGASKEGVGAHTAGIFNGDAQFRIGAREHATELAWDGLIDEVIIFNRALSAAEVTEIFTYGISGDKGGSD